MAIGTGGAGRAMVFSVDEGSTTGVCVTVVVCALGISGHSSEGFYLI